MPSVGERPEREYCSCAGKLKKTSAKIKVRLGLWQKTNSLFAWLSIYSYSNSASNSSLSIRKEVLLVGVKTCVKWGRCWDGSVLEARFSGSPSTPMIVLAEG